MTRNEPFRVSCPGCGRNSKAIEEKFRGRRVRCPACRSVFILDDPPKLIALGPDIGPAMPSDHMDATHHAPPADTPKADLDATRLVSPIKQVEPEISSPEKHDPTDTDATCPAAMPMPDTGNDATVMGGPPSPDPESDATRLAGTPAPVADSDATRLGKLTSAAHHTDSTRLAVQAEHRTDGSEKDVPLAWQPGDRFLETYRVEDILGRGAFGTVYRVRHLGWRMDLAVKSPNPEALDAHGADIFTSEAETWSELGLHPHIVSCYYVRNLGGIPRVFAEYVDGGSLQELIEKDGVGDLDKKIDIAIQFAWGLAYAHARDMVHKDVKPANVMLTADGRVKVTDFGLTRAKAGRGAGEEVDIGGGRTIMVDGTGCTPSYASPEQLAGKPVSRAADAYSWAVSILAMFTGGASWRVGAAASVVLENLLRPADGNTPIMPEHLAALLRECFILDPEQRLRDMNAVADRLVALYREITGKDYPLRAPRQDQALSADTLVNRALSLIDLGHKDRAKALLKEALTLQPHHPEASYNLGLLRWRSGEISDIELVNELEEVRVTHTRTWIDELYLGLVHMERGDYEAAVAVLESVEEEEGKSDPRLLDALRQSRTLHDKTGKNVICWDHLGPIRYLDTIASPDGKAVFAQAIHTKDEEKRRLDDGHTVSMIDAKTGRLLREFSDPGQSVRAMALSRDGRRLATGTRYCDIRIWDVHSGRCVNSLRGNAPSMVKGDEYGIRCLCFTPDGKRILSCGSDADIIEWDITTGGRRVLSGHTAEVRWINPSKKGHRLASWDGKNLIVWDFPSGMIVRNIPADSAACSTASGPRLTPDGRYLLMVSGSSSHRHRGRLNVFNIETGEKTEAGQAGAYKMAVHANGRLAVTAAVAISSIEESVLELWHVPQGRCLRTFFMDMLSITGRNTFLINSLAFENGDPLAIALDVHNFDIPCHGQYRVRFVYESRVAPWMLCRILKSETMTEDLRTFETRMEKAEAAFAKDDFPLSLNGLSDARTISGYERHPRALDLCAKLARRLPRIGLAGAWLMHGFRAHAYPVKAIAPSPDGSFFVSAVHVTGDDKETEPSMKAWRPESAEYLGGSGHCGDVDCIRVTPDMRYVLHANRDIFRCWNLENGKVGRMTTPDKRSVTEMCAGPDGRHIFLLSHLMNRAGTFSSVLVLDMAEIGKTESHKVPDHLTGFTRFLAENRPMEVKTVLPVQPEARGLDVRKDGRAMAYSTRDGVYLQDIPSSSSGPKSLHAFKRGFDSPDKIFFLRDGRLAFTQLDAIVIHDPSGNAEKRTLDLPKQNFGTYDKRWCGFVVSEDDRFAFCFIDTSILVWDLRAGALIRTLQGHQARITALCLSKDARYLISGDQAGHLSVWALEWQLEPVPPQHWDESARTILHDFVVARQSTWCEEDIESLIHELQCAGLGWISAEGVRGALESMIGRTE